MWYADLMRRALSIGRVVMVYLLLGFVTTWAVAWGLALLPPGDAYGTGDDSSTVRSLGAATAYRGGLGSARKHYLFWGDSRFEFEPGVWELSLFPDPTGHADWSILGRVAELGSSDNWGMQATGEKLEGPGTRVIDDARGFPFLAVWCTWATRPPRQVESGTWAWSDLRRDHLHGGFLLPDHVGQLLSGEEKFRALPYYPIWSGLALNTAFYALLFFGFVRFVKGTRHLLRFRRGLCPMCKYDRVFDYSRPCPECGHQGGVGRTRKNHAASSSPSAA